MKKKLEKKEEQKETKKTESSSEINIPKTKFKKKK